MQSALSTPSYESTAAAALPWEGQLGSLGFTWYCVLAATVAFSGSLALFKLADLLNGWLHILPPLHDPGWRLGPGIVFGNLVFAPLVETVLLIGGLKLLLRCRLSHGTAVIVSAVLWGLLHGADQPLRFFGTVWSFAVFGYGYLLWRRRQPARGFGAAAWPHALVNTVPTIMLFIGG